MQCGDVACLCPDKLLSVLSQNYVNVAMTVLEIDPNLKKVHASQATLEPRLGVGGKRPPPTLIYIFMWTLCCAQMHAKLGARVAEEEFWRSYFFRCACLRVSPPKHYRTEAS